MYGKYDEELLEEKELILQIFAECNDIFTYNQICGYFKKIKTKMMDLSQKDQTNTVLLYKEEKEKLITYVQNIAYYTLDKCKADFNYTANEALEKCWNIHVSKNYLYQDGWYRNGIFGIFYDLNRKMSRMDSLFNEKLDDCIETKEDTYLDLLNYCIMFSVSLKNPNINMFEGI